MKSIEIASLLLQAADQVEAAGSSTSNSDSYFCEVDAIVGNVMSASTDMEHVEPIEDRDNQRKHNVKHVGKVKWAYEGSNVIEIDVDKIVFSDENSWNFAHAAGVKQQMKDKEMFEVPAARIYKVTQEDFEKTQEAQYERGELEDEYGMEKPWEESDVGEEYAHLLDGNHRAAAAMALGVSTILVYIGEDYREP